MQALPKKGACHDPERKKLQKKLKKLLQKVLTNGEESGIIVELPQSGSEMILEN